MSGISRIKDVARRMGLVKAAPGQVAVMASPSAAVNGFRRRTGSKLSDAVGTLFDFASMGAQSQIWALGLGDSITSNDGTNNALANPPLLRFASLGILTWLEYLSQGRIRRMTAGIPAGDTSGQIAGVQVMKPGSGYAAGAQLVLTPLGGGSGGAGFLANAVLDGSGGIVGAIIVTPGNGYATVNSGGYVLTVQNGGSGTGFQGTVTITGRMSVAVGGSSSAEALARNGIFIGLGAQMGVLLVGTNDPSIGLTAAETKANIKAICQDWIANGILPLVIAPLPADQVMGLSRIKRNNHVKQWLLRDLPAELPGVVAVDASAGVVDPDTGNLVSGMSIDNLHPRPLMSYVIAKNIWSAIAGLFGAAQSLSVDPLDLFDSAENPTGSLLAQRMVSNSASFPSPGAPSACAAPFTGVQAKRTTWAKKNTGTWTGTADGTYESPRTDGEPGGRYVMTINLSSGGTDAAKARLQFWDATPTSGGSSPDALNLVEGDQVYLEIETDLTGGTNIGTFELTLGLQGAGYATIASATGMQGSVAAANFPQAPGKGVLRTPVLTVPAGILYTSAYLDINAAATGAFAAVLKTAKLAMRKL